MTEEQNPETLPAVPGDPAPEPLPFTEAAAARLALSHEMIRIAKHALATADPANDTRLRPGQLFGEVAQFEAAAEFAINAAVVAEKAAGTSWDQIGEWCEPATDKRGAQRKHGRAWKEWQTELARDPWLYRTENLSDRTEGQAAEVAEILTAAGRLDPDQDGAAAITATLPRHTLLSLLSALHRDEEKLRAAYAYPDPEAVAHLAEARSTVYDRLAATAADNNRDDERRTNESLAAMERQRAAAYRGRPTEAVPYLSSTAALPRARQAIVEYVPELANVLAACSTLAVAERLAAAVFARNTPSSDGIAAYFHGVAEPLFVVAVHAAALADASPAEMLAWAENGLDEPVRILTRHYGPDIAAWPGKLALLAGTNLLPADQQGRARAELARVIAEHQRPNNHVDEPAEPTP